jgi:hypothetical protein
MGALFYVRESAEISIARTSSEFGIPAVLPRTDCPHVIGCSDRQADSKRQYYCLSLSIFIRPALAIQFDNWHYVYQSKAANDLRRLR